MGQKISRTSRFQELMDDLGIDGYDVGFLENEDDDTVDDEEMEEDSSESEDEDDDSDDNDDDDDEEQEPVPSVGLTVPVDDNLLNNYTLNDLDQLIKDEFIVWVTSESFICGHKLQHDDLQMEYPALEILVDFTDSSSKESKRYQINPASHNDAELIINGILHLMRRTMDFKDCKVIHLKTQIEANSIDQPLTIDQKNFHVLLDRFDSKDDGCSLTFRGITFNVEQTAILSSNNFPDNIKLELYHFHFENECSDVFIDNLAKNYGPTKLFIRRSYNIANSSLCMKICNALSHGKNSRLKELRLHIALDEESYITLCDMLQTNIGLVTLSVYLDIFNKDLIFQSLHSHPTLEDLTVELLLVDLDTLTKKGKKLATEQIINLLRHNHKIKELQVDRLLHLEAYDERMLQNDVRQCLQINKKWHQIQQINNEVNEKVRSHLIGEFLIKENYYSNRLNLIWHVIRENNLLVINRLRKYYYNTSRKRSSPPNDDA